MLATLMTAWLLGQVIDRDMTLIEPVTTATGAPIQNLLQCTAQITDSSGTMDQRVIPASAPTGGGVHTIDLTGKTGFTTVTAACLNTEQELGGSASNTRTFPGDPPARPEIRD
ncbi:MAG: hypothetical protein V3R16_02605 [Nitrospirales bacterium]